MLYSCKSNKKWADSARRKFIGNWKSIQPHACDQAAARNYTGSKWRQIILGSMDCALQRLNVLLTVLFKRMNALMLMHVKGYFLYNYIFK